MLINTRSNLGRNLGIFWKQQGTYMDNKIKIFIVSPADIGQRQLRATGRHIMDTYNAKRSMMSEVAVDNKSNCV
jgi:hypothetical protein